MPPRLGSQLPRESDPRKSYQKWGQDRATVLCPASPEMTYIFHILLVPTATNPALLNDTVQGSENQEANITRAILAMTDWQWKVGYCDCDLKY